jgi:hypothetical protein
MTRRADSIRDSATGVVRGTGKQMGGFKKFLLRGTADASPSDR